jgi:hypothetical protein
MPYRYKSILRNMIKLLALHDIYSTDDTGEFINTERKTKAARERVERLRRPITRFTSTGPPPPRTPSVDEMMDRMRQEVLFDDSSQR